MAKQRGRRKTKKTDKDDVDYDAISLDDIDAEFTQEVLEDPHERKKIRLMCDEDPYYFMRNALQYRLLTKDLHKRLINEQVEAHKQGKYYNCLIPRDHFKSTIFATGKPISKLFQNPSSKCSIISASGRIAVDRGDEIVNQLKAPLVRLLYPEVEIARARSDKENVSIKIKWNGTLYEKREPNVSCFSAESNYTGTRIDYLGMDDMVAPKHRGNLIGNPIEKYKTLIPCLGPNAEVVNVGTRWEYGDLHGYFLGEGSSSGDQAADWVSTVLAVEVDGQFILPTRWNWEALKKKRRQMQDDVLFYSQYYNQIVSTSTNELTYKDLCYFNAREFINDGKLAECNIWIFIDPAITKKMASDKSAFIVIAENKETHLRYVVEAVIKHTTQDDIVEQIVRFINIYHNPKIFIESTALQQVLKRFIDDKLVEKGIDIRVRDASHEGVPKEIRIQKLVSPIKKGWYVFDSSQRYLTDQVIHWTPNAKNNDGIDALAYSDKYMPPCSKSYWEYSFASWHGVAPIGSLAHAFRNRGEKKNIISEGLYFVHN